MEQEEGEKGTHMGKQPSTECHNIHGVGRDSETGKLSTGYQSPSRVRRVSAWKSRPHSMAESKQIGNVSIRRAAHSWVSKHEWDEKIREWGAARGAGLCWASAWREGGCSSTEAEQGEEDVHTGKQHRAGYVSLSKVRTSTRVGGGG